MTLLSDIKISQCVGLQKKTSHELGIEIELEYKTPQQLPIQKPWILKGDGSLRHYGVELVTTPLKFNQLKDTLSQLKLLPTPLSSVRCGTHLHIDTLSYSLQELLNFCAVYYILESYIIQISKKDRHNNPFCRTLNHSEGIYSILTDFFLNEKIPYIDTSKYSCLNLGSLETFGTIEFRFLDSSLNTDKLFREISFLFNFFHETTQYPIEETLKSSFVNLVNTFIPKHIQEQIELPIFEFDSPMQMGKFYINELHEKLKTKTILIEDSTENTDNYRLNTHNTPYFAHFNNEATIRILDE